MQWERGLLPLHSSPTLAGLEASHRRGLGSGREPVFFVPFLQTTADGKATRSNTRSISHPQHTTVAWLPCPQNFLHTHPLAAAQQCACACGPSTLSAKHQRPPQPGEVSPPPATGLHNHDPGPTRLPFRNIRSAIRRHHPSLSAEATTLTTTPPPPSPSLPSSASS